MLQSAGGIFPTGRDAIQPEDMPGKLTPYLGSEAIDTAVRRLAGELDRDYADRPAVLVGVLKGGFIFLADLVRRMTVSALSVEFLRLSSYGGNTVSSGAPRIVGGYPTTRFGTGTWCWWRTSWTPG